MTAPPENLNSSDLMSDAVRSAMRVDEIMRLMSESAQWSAILYCRFCHALEAAHARNERITFVIFASTQRLYEWMMQGNCSAPVVLDSKSVELAMEQLGPDGYPRTLAQVAADKTKCALVICTSLLHLGVQRYCCTVFRMPAKQDRITSYATNFPLHFQLQENPTKRDEIEK